MSACTDRDRMVEAPRPSGMRTTGWLLALGLALAATTSHAQAPANPYDYTRTDAFTYDSTTGFALTHTVEPNAAGLCRVDTYGYDSYGNKTSVTTANCAGASGGARFATQLIGSAFAAPANQTITVAGTTASVTYATGLFPTTVSNAATQSELRQYDPRFGAIIGLTGPNALATGWTLDDFGRVVRETAPDGTSTVSFYCVLSSSGLDTSSNTAGCATPASGEAPPDAVAFLQMEPRSTADAKTGPFVRTYSDRLGRMIRTVTQSFDGAGQPSARSGALIAQDLVYNSFGALVLQSQPYFLASASSTTVGSNDVGATATTYDVLGRPTGTLTSDPHGNAGSQTFGSFGARTAAQTSYAYAGLTTTTTNDKGQSRVEERNAIAEVVRITDATGAQLVHQTDAFGNLVATKDALQNAIAIAFDIRGNRLSVNDPDGGITLDCYDALGELVAYQYANMRGATAPGACPTTPNNGAAVATTVTNWVTQAYDVLGRMTQRIEPEFASTWTYDKYADSTACDKGIGKLCQAVTSAGLNRKIVYDAVGRPLNTLVATGAGPSFASAVAYDAPTGRVASVTYPTGLQVGYAYTALGYPEKMLLGTAATLTPLAPPAGGVSSGSAVTLAANTLLWQAQAVNAWGVMEKQSYGNGVITAVAFEAATGRTTDLTAGAGIATNVLNHHYVWDSIDNLQSRNDANGDGSGAVTETFNYADGLNRLTGYTVAGPAIPNLSRTVQLQYNALGMLLYKTDVGNYSYGAQGAGSVRPHALQSVIGSTVTTTNGYDSNGNLVSADAGKYRSLTYTSFNLPDSQTGLSGPSGAPQYTWGYDDSHARIREVKTLAGVTRTTWYLHPDNAGGLGFESEINSTSNPALNDNRHFLTAAGEVVGVLVSTGNVPAPTGTAPAAICSTCSIALSKVEYWHQDHLGSLAATTDHLGNITARYAYDPFGKRRYSSGSYDANGQLVIDWSSTTNSGTARGFSGHEELDDVGLVHMNGRLFDPTLGVFLQADPLVVHPHDLQSFNRYGYCLNNPLTCTDPSGFQAAPAAPTNVPVECGGQECDPSHLNAFGQNLPTVVEIIGCLNGSTSAFCTQPPTGKPNPFTDGDPGSSQKSGSGSATGVSVIGGTGSGLGGGFAGGGQGGGAGKGSAGGTGSGGTGSGNSPNGAGSGAGSGAGAGSPGTVSSGKYAGPGVTSAHGGTSGSSSLSGWIHAGLGAASFCPSICGSAFSAVDGVVSLAEGDNVGAAISFGAAAVGIVSDAGAAKIAALTIREVSAAARGTREAEAITGNFSWVLNQAGGKVYTSIGKIDQDSFANIVFRAVDNGETVDILSGVHGFPNGNTLDHIRFFNDDVKTFGSEVGVTIHNMAEMTPDAIKAVLQKTGTIIGGFCDSGACLLGHLK